MAALLILTCSFLYWCWMIYYILLVATIYKEGWNIYILFIVLLAITVLKNKCILDLGFDMYHNTLIQPASPTDLHVCHVPWNETWQKTTYIFLIEAPCWCHLWITLYLFTCFPFCPAVPVGLIFGDEPMLFPLERKDYTWESAEIKPTCS